MIRETWPASAPYILVPPLAITVLVRLSPGREGAITYVVVALLSGLVAQLAAGATVAFYLRRYRAATQLGAVDWR